MTFHEVACDTDKPEASAAAIRESVLNLIWLAAIICGLALAGVLAYALLG